MTERSTPDDGGMRFVHTHCGNQDCVDGSICRGSAPGGPAELVGQRDTTECVVNLDALRGRGFGTSTGGSDR